MTLEFTRLNKMHAALEGWRAAGDRIALVPTMGALHAGHMALMHAAQREAARVVVSIFVNPTQFGPSEDFNRYPRPLEDDLVLLREAGVDGVWLPSVEVMYPQGAHASIHVPELGDGLEGTVRPGHFDGVATVVAELLKQVSPDVAVFGEKDYQQLCVIKHLVAQLGLATTIIGVPTQRENDGLALSSRNRYLDAQQRVVARRLNQVMRHSIFALREGRPVVEVLEKAERLLLDGGFDAVDYVALCDAQTLAPLATAIAPARLLVAARLGTTRLIDNMAV